MTRRVAAVLLSLALLSACGSTASRAQRNAAQARSGAGLGGVESGGASTAANGAGAATAAGGGAVTGGASSSAASTGVSGGAGARAATAAVGPGVTADKIYVGLSYTSSNAANTAIGAAGISQGDPKAETQAIVDDINAHGGVAGRKFEAVWHEIDGNSNAPWDVTDQQTCDDWTQDHKIFVALAESLADSDTMVGCLNSRGVGMVTDNFSGSDSARFQRFPAYVELVMMGLDRAAAAEVAALKAQNWFTGWDTLGGAPSPTKSKIGIVTYDGAAWSHAVDQVMVPALRAIGYAPASGDIVRVPPEKATSDTGTTGAATSSAVLKLRGDGVTHVIVFDRKGLLTLFFTRAADSQGYRPRYGFDTQNGVQALVDGAALPKEQLVGSKGIGWYPDIDLPFADSPQYGNDRTRACLALMKSKNIALTDANAQALALNNCSSWWLLRDALNASGGVLTRAGFIDGLARLGSSFLAAGNFANRFSATQRDGVGAYRFFGYDAGCSCMRYSGGNVAAPS